jgi:hypothetical protein
MVGHPLRRARNLLLVALMGFACLPSETRPPPGSLTVTATGSPQTISGFSTADGWHVTFHRVLLSIGYVSVGTGRGPMRGDDSCDVYAGANYGRILDLSLAGAQRVSEVFALGECEFGFRVLEPASNAVLGSGVSEAERAFMRSESDDSMTLFVSGSAVGKNATKEFRWAFRRSLDYTDCGLGTEGGPGKVVYFAEESPRVLDILIRVEALFQDELDEAHAELRFGAFALADDEYGNGDGEVTLAELRNVALTDSRVGVGSQSTGDQPWKTLRDWVVQGLLPAIPRVGGTGECSIEEGSSPSRGPGFL